MKDQFNDIPEGMKKDYSPGSYIDEPSKYSQYDKEVKKQLEAEYNIQLDFAFAYKERGFAKTWRQIDAYMFHDPIKLNSGALKKSIVGSSINYLFVVFNFLFANILTDNTEENLVVEPGFIPTTKADLLNSGGNDEQQENARLEMVTMLLQIKQLRNLIKFYWKHAGIDETNKRVFFDYLTYGTGVAEIFWNEEDKKRHKDGELEFHYIPISSFYLEPKVVNWRDSRYVIVCQNINLLNLQNLHNLTNEDMKDIVKCLASSGYNANNIQLKEEDMTTWNQTVPYNRYYKKYLDKKGDIKVSCNYFVGYKNANLVDVVEDIGINDFPFAMVHSYKKPTDSYGQSIFKFLLPAQKMLIQQDAIVQLRALQAANPIILVNDRAGIDIEHLNKKGGFKSNLAYGVTGDPSKAVFVQKLNEIPQDSLMYMETLKNYMNSMANTTETATGQNKITGASAGAVNQNTMNATLPFRIRTKEIESYYNDAVNILVKMLVAKQSVTRSIVAVNKSSVNYQYLGLTTNMAEEFSDLALNCKIYVKAQTAAEQEKQKQMMLQIYTLAVQYPELRGAISAIDLIRNLGLPNEEELVANLQMQNDETYMNLATQITQLIQANDEMAVQAQAMQAQLQSLVSSGQVSQEDAEKQLQNIPQPMPVEQLVNIIFGLIKNDPAKLLENEAGITQSAVSGAENASEQ